MRSSRLWATLAIGLSLGFLAPPPAQAGSVFLLITGYAGTPSAPFSSAVLDTSKSGPFRVLVEDTTTISSAVVQIEVGTSSGSLYIASTCTNPGNTTATRCYVTVPQVNSLRATVSTYVSGTINVKVETFVTTNN